MFLNVFYSRLLLLSTLLLIVSCRTVKSTNHNTKAFVKIFNGKNLDGWQGDTTYWHVYNNTIVGEVTFETILKRNTFLIWRKGAPANFELTLMYRISSKGNSGVNYRSVEIDTLPLALQGYQADIDGKDKYGDGYPRHTGQNYEERGRQFLATRGQKVIIASGGKPIVIDTIAPKDVLLKNINYNGWNKLHIIAIGNNLRHIINGQLMSEVTDNDVTNRKMNGLLGVQVHVGPPMKVEFKDIYLKILD